MARQNKPDVVDFECETTADLTSLPRLQVSNGCRAWISAAGATHGLWCLDNQNTNPIGAGVVATSDGVGRWIYYGAGSATGNGMIYFLTLAAMAAAPGPAVNTMAWQDETDAPYEFVPGDVTVVDGYTVIANTGGTNGRWLLRSDKISIAPIGGGSDDWARLNLAMAACAGKTKIILRAGAWVCAVSGAVPANTDLEIERGSTITSSLASGTFLNFVFFKFLGVAGAGVLSATPTVGSNQFSSSVSMAVGTEFWVRSVTANTFLAQRYVVTAVAGVGPFTITVERAILFPFTANDQIQPITSDTNNISLRGNNCLIRPAAGVDGGDRAIEFTGLKDGLIEGFRIGPNAAGTSFPDAMSVDIASLRVRVVDVYVSASTASNGIMIESSERVEVVHSFGDGVGDGITIFDSVDIGLIDCGGSACGSACMRLDSNGVTNVGCKDVRVNGGVFSDSPNDGALINRAVRTTLTGCRFINNGSIGVLLTNSTSTLFVNCSAKSNTTYCIQVGASNVNTRFVNYTNEGGAISLQIDGSDVDIDGMYVTGAVTGQCIRTDGGILTARALRLLATASSNLIYLVAGSHKINDSYWVGTSSGLNCAGATVQLTNCSGAGTGIGVYNSAGTVIFSAGNDFTGFTTPVRNDNGAANVSHDAELRFAAEPVVPAAGTWYMALNGALSAVEAEVQVIIKKKTTFRDIDLFSSAAPGGAVVCTYTVRKNNGDTALIVTLTGAQAVNTKDGTPPTPNATCINYVPGDILSIKLVVGAGSVMANPRATAVGVAA